MLGLTLAAVVGGSAELARAQSSNTIRIIFPYAAGGSGDATIRLIAD
jgi:tripartite-type tricarboxylate transporter receptor subunit TctC